MNPFSLSKSTIISIALLAAFLVALTTGCGSERAAAPGSHAAAGSSSEREPAAQPEESAQPQPSAAPPHAPEEPEGPKLELTQEGITLVWREDGKLRMEARARSLKADEITKTGTLLDFSARLYENDKLTAEIQAPRAVADTEKRILTATGGVTLKSLERDTTVRAQWMRWYAREQRVVGNAGVRIESAMGAITAAAFEADTALKTLTVTDSAKGLKL